MKTLLITTILAIVTLTSTVRAEINPSAVVSTVTNAVQKAQQAVDQAQAALSNAEKLAASVIPNVPASPSNVTVVATAPPTNAPASTNSVVAKTKETINDAVIDILHGAKTAGGEIYQASKTAITKAVDFTMEQAPLVVTEFLHWKLAEAVIYALAWATPAFVLLFIARAFNKQSKSADVPKEDRYKTDQNDYAILKWVFRAVAFIALTINLTTNGLVITKILVAPRVYLIEYVVSTVHNGTPPSQ